MIRRTTLLETVAERDGDGGAEKDGNRDNGGEEENRCPSLSS